MIFDFQENKFYSNDEIEIIEKSGGYFETIRYFEGKLCFITDHVARLENTLRLNGITDYPNFQEILIKFEQLFHLIQRDFTVLKFVYYPKTKNIYGQFRPRIYMKSDYENGYRVQVKESPRMFLKKYLFKETDRKEYQVDRLKATKLGYNELLYQDKDQNITEGSYTNFFIVKDGIIITPPLTQAMIPGIARKKIIEIFSDQILEAHVDFEMIKNADSAFISNALMGIMPVSEVAYKGEVIRFSVAKPLELSQSFLLLWEREAKSKKNN